MLPEHDRGRPGEKAASSVTAGDAPSLDDNNHRCRRCRAHLSAVRSVALGIGPRCEKAEHADLIADVFADWLAAC